MAITHWPLKERPREKLLDLGPDALSEAELLAIFLRTGVKGKTAVDLARDLLNHFGGLRNLMEAPLINFCETRGLGPAKYAQLKAVLEMGRRHLYAKLQEPDHVKNSDQTKEYIVSQLRSYKREVFGCLFLDSRHRILGFDELFFGTLDCANVHPREVMKSALEHNAAAVIFAHNHPSGISEPSREDISITKQLIKTLEFIEVRVLDHIVVGNGEVTSFAERGLL